MKPETILKLLGAVVLTAAAVSASAGTLPFAFNPSGASPALTPGTGDSNPLGLLTYPTGSYTGDTFNLSDNATITVDTSGNMTETGIFLVSNVQYQGNPLGAKTTGIQYNYGLYGIFTATGVGGLAPDTLTSLDFTLYADPTFNDIFAADGSSVTSGSGDDFQLATGSLLPGQGTARIVGPPFNLSLQANTTFTESPGQSGFYLYPAPFYLNLGSSFTAYSSTGSITTTGDCSGLTSVCTVTITSGGGTAGFITVPEPGTLVILGIGLIGMGVVGVRKRGSKFTV